METFLQILVALAILAALMFVGYYFQNRVEKKRLHALRPLAIPLKMKFIEKGPDNFERLYQALNLFQRGKLKKMYNVFEGNIDKLHVTMFDYDYTTGWGRGTATWKQTAVLFEAPNLSLPSFSMEPEGLGHKIAEFFAHNDIVINEAPRFCEKYLLKGTDETRIKELFDHNKLNYFSELGEYCVQGAGSQLLVFVSNIRSKPGQLDEMLKNYLEVAKVFID